jgi:hypothetical protein
MFRVLTALALLAVLAGCATLTESECATADWYEIGFRDGQNGRPSTYFGQHVEACTKHGIMPRQSPWEKGRQAGLRLFCVPERAYEVGRSGHAFPAVCTPEETVEMRPAWDWGREYYRLTQKIHDVERKIDRAENEIDEIADPADPRIAYLELRIFRYENEIRRLERMRRRYAYWPV